MQVRSRVPVIDVQRISLSPYQDHCAVFHLENTSLSQRRGDFVCETRHVIEMIAKLYLVIQNATGKPPNIDVSSKSVSPPYVLQRRLIEKGGGEEGTSIENVLWKAFCFNIFVQCEKFFLQ